MAQDRPVFIEDYWLVKNVADPAQVLQSEQLRNF